MDGRIVTHIAERGVWVAPWLGDDGELVLIAVTRRGRLAAPPFAIPHGADRVAASDAMWALLDVVDPDTVAVLRAV